MWQAGGDDDLNLIPLSETALQEETEVVSLACDQGMKVRLNDLGLLEGSKITCLYPSALGDPRAYLVRGAVLGIRNRDAAKILVRKGAEK